MKTTAEKLLHWADTLDNRVFNRSHITMGMREEARRLQDAVHSIEPPLLLRQPQNETTDEMLAVLKSIREGIAGIERTTRLGNKDLEHRLQAIENVLVSTAGRGFLQTLDRL